MASNSNRINSKESNYSENPIKSDTNILDTYKSQVTSFALNNTKVRADHSPLVTSMNQTVSQRQRKKEIYMKLFKDHVN